ncbi:protein TAPT1-like protein [Trichonephila clavipes]|nr:protein TAPT1-like protein [Trichonephila clavipes]
MTIIVIDYLYGKLRRGYLLENDEQQFTERCEKFYIFLKIPREIEKISPLQIVSYYRSLKLVFSALFGTHHSCRSLQPAEICDLLKVII